MAISVSSPRPPSAPLFMAFFCASHLVFLFSFVSLSLCTHAYPSEPLPSFTSALLYTCTIFPSFLPSFPHRSFLPSFLPSVGIIFPTPSSSPSLSTCPGLLLTLASSQRLTRLPVWPLLPLYTSTVFPPFPFHSHHQPAPLLIPV